MTLPDPADLLLMLAAAAAGLGAGALHLRSLRRATDLLLAGRWRGVALQLARFAALAAFLALCAMAGAGVLLAAAAGVLVGRARQMRRERA